MSSQSGQDKTEQATPKRLADARKKGQVPRSRELTIAAVTLTAGGALWMLGGTMLSALNRILIDGLSFQRAVATDPLLGVQALHTSIERGVLLLLPFFLVLIAVTLLAPALIGGWSFSFQAMAFKIDKLNPVKGLGRVFGAKGLMELVKAMAKFGLVGSVAVAYLVHSDSKFLALANQPLHQALGNTATLMVQGLLIFSTPLLIIAAIDVPFQLWQHAKQMRMTRQEVRDEAKQTEGNPEVKGKIRALQREQANRRMMEEVPKADVVITNPTHFSVALRYDAERMRAPIVVAKGADAVAARIREIATEHAVPLVSAPPLARMLFRTTDLNQEIPAALYRAVAQVLTYLYQLREVRREGGVAPDLPEMDVDES